MMTHDSRTFRHEKTPKTIDFPGFFDPSKSRLSLAELYERIRKMPFGIFPASNGLLLADRSAG